jgi:hypothetical protein
LKCIANWLRIMGDVSAPGEQLNEDILHEFNFGTREDSTEVIIDSDSKRDLVRAINLCFVIVVVVVVVIRVVTFNWSTILIISWA